MDEGISEVWTPEPLCSLLVAGLLLRTIRYLTGKLRCSFYRFLARFSGRRRGEAGVGGATPSYIAAAAASAASGRMLPPPLATLILVVSTMFGIADACSSRSTPKPRPPSPTARPNITFHTYACPPAYATWYCLNGATCFTVKIGESLLYNCECSDGYMGQRCEFKDLEGSYLPNRNRVYLETASIAGGATIAVILVVIMCVAAYIHYHRKQKERRIAGSDRVDGRDLERRPFSSRSLSIPIAHVRHHSPPPSAERTPPPVSDEGGTVRLFGTPP